MAGIRFLERLRLQARGMETVTPGAEEVLQSVIDHITKIMNTRQGSTLISDDFGIPDFTGLGVDFSTDRIPAIEREIEKFISRVEPRLTNVRIRFSPNEGKHFQLAFTLTADMTVDRDNQFIRLITEVNSMGRVSVSE